MRRSGAYAGLLMVLLSTSILIVSLLSNPWFSLQNNAISDLGRSSAKFSEVYNIGLVASGFLFVFFLSQAYQERETRLGRLGLVFFGFTGIALLLMGFISNGVTLSDLVALLFTLTGASSVLLLGITFIWQEIPYAQLFVGIIILGTIFTVVAILMFEGLAVAEFIAIIGYDLTIGILVIELYL